MLDSSKIISTPSFETVENSTTKLYERIWKEKLKFSENLIVENASENTSVGSLDDNGIEDMGKENIITTSDDTNEQIEAPLEKRIVSKFWGCTKIDIFFNFHTAQVFFVPNNNFFQIL